jgi:metal-dependent amidase/aminoacylase/carboxypeptidase family protein
LICIAGIAGAIAAARALVEFDTPGKVVLLGTPAEEKDGGKIKLLKAGAYKQVGSSFPRGIL